MVDNCSVYIVKKNAKTNLRNINDQSWSHTVQMFKADAKLAPSQWKTSLQRRLSLAGLNSKMNSINTLMLMLQWCQHKKVRCACFCCCKWFRKCAAYSENLQDYAHNFGGWWYCGSSTGLIVVSKFKPRLSAQWAIFTHSQSPSQMKT